MSASSKPNSPRFSPLKALGIDAMLLGFFLLLSPLSRLAYASYPVTFLFGTVGFYGLIALLFYLGARPFLPSFKARGGVVVGVLLTLLGLSFLFATTLDPGDASYALGFGQRLSAIYSSSPSSLYGASYLSGVIPGAILGLLRDASGDVLPLVLSILILALGLLLALFPFIKVFFRKIRVASAISRSRKAEDDSYLIEVEEDDAPSPLPSYEPTSKRPSLSFSTAGEASDSPAPSVKTRYEFTPAGGGTFPKRRQLRSEVTSSAPLDAPEIQPMPATAPVEIAPSSAPRPSGPLLSSGLREAKFSPGKEETGPLGGIETARFGDKPAPVSPSAAPAPAPKAEPLPIVPSSTPLPPKDETLHLTPAEPLAPKVIVSPAPSPIEESADEEESYEVSLLDDEDDSYVESDNAPIALMPEVAKEEIIVPKEEPLPEPSFAATRVDEPEPAVDEDLEGPLPPYEFPPASLLFDPSGGVNKEEQDAECEEKKGRIDAFFVEFGVQAHVVSYLVGPSITRFMVQMEPGVSVSVLSRAIPDLEIRLDGIAILFVERVPGSPYSALEIPNEKRRVVAFKEVFTALPPRNEGKADLHIPFGLDIEGKLKQGDLAKFPHMLVAGTSGSGKSVFAHGLLTSLVMRNRPEDLKLVLIDPKRGVEMARYKDLPHLLCPVVKEATQAKNALKKLCDLMDERYKMFENALVTDISGYNRDYALPEGKKRMPYIVVFIDEFSDIVGECKIISDYVLRIAQKARACGIHLIVATQRPDVKVITGTIKSNLLCRVALTVASSTDSVTVIGQGGAEELYGYGDMLIDCPEISKRGLQRAQGCLAEAREAKIVCDFIRKQLPPSYDPDFLDLDDHDDDGPEIRDGAYEGIPASPAVSPAELKNASQEEKYQYIKSVIMTREYCSISMIQREFEVGFPRAGKILARLQEEGIVARPGDSPNNSKGCRVLVHPGDEIPDGEGGDE